MDLNFPKNSFATTRSAQDGGDSSGPIRFRELNLPISGPITIRDMVIYPDFMNGGPLSAAPGECGPVLAEGESNTLLIHYRIETFSARGLTWNLILKNGGYSYTLPIPFGPESISNSTDSGEDYRNIGGIFQQTVHLTPPYYLGKGTCGIFVSSPFMKETKIADVRLSSYAETAIHWLDCSKTAGPETLGVLARYFSSATAEEGKTGLDTLVGVLGQLKNRSDDPGVSYDWGRIFFLDKKYPQGKNPLREAADRNPQNGEYQYWAGRILEQSGDVRDAALYYSRALSLLPENLELIQRLKKIYRVTENTGALHDLESKYLCAGENVLFYDGFENPDVWVSPGDIDSNLKGWVVDSRFMKTYVDSEFRYEGERSLRVDMNEADNIYHTRRRIAVKPNTPYRLVYFLKARDMKRKPGIEPYSGGFRVMVKNTSELVWGENVEQELPWTEFTSVFTTKENPFIDIELRRFGSSHGDDFLWGSVWLDNLCLIEE